jgi:prepilin-type N-terminal cleavage/methylation domain-containing protein
MKRNQSNGFTLIELSIVLVIIGLIVGGVLVGRDLIAAATVRAQIGQIEKYNTAVNTFLSKYNCLPGDCVDAANFGFVARGSRPGEGDGNGIIEGYNFQGDTSQGVNQLGGETLMFWMDLSAAKLIEGNFNQTDYLGNGNNHLSSEAPYFFPAAKLGGGNYVSVWSLNDLNYFAVCLTAGGWGDGGFGVTGQIVTDQYAARGITVSQAYAIDSKMDDGLPQSGRVMAMAPVELGAWANIGFGPYGTWLPPGVQTQGSSETCYDDNNNPDLPEQYSLSQNNGSGINCTLSFQFQ